MEHETGRLRPVSGNLTRMHAELLELERQIGQLYDKQPTFAKPVRSRYSQLPNARCPARWTRPSHRNSGTMR